MIKVTVENFDSVIKGLEEVGETVDNSSVEVGVLDVSEQEALVSKVLEHRWHREGPDAPEHWATGSQYVTWAFAARTARTLEEQVLDQVVDGLLDQNVTGDEFWNRIGRAGATTMKQIIRGIQTPGNAPATVERKGFNNPLIDTGGMLGSVTWKVKQKNEPVESYPKNIPPMGGA